MAKGRAGSKVETNSVTEVSHRLHSLLQTMRCIAQHEDRLCTMLHDVKGGKLNDAVRAELRTLLDDMPGVEYELEIDALRATL